MSSEIFVKYKKYQHSTCLKKYISFCPTILLLSNLLELSIAPTNVTLLKDTDNIITNLGQGVTVFHSLLLCHFFPFPFTQDTHLVMPHAARQPRAENVATTRNPLFGQKAFPGLESLMPYQH